MEQKEKMVSVNFEAMKQRAADTARGAASALKERISAAAETVSATAKGKKDQAMALLLDKGIALSQAQLGALESIRKKLG